MKSNSNLRCFLAAPGSQCLAIFIDPNSSSLSSGQPEISAYQHSVWNTVCPLPESLQLERVCHPPAKLVCSQKRAGLCMCQQHKRSRTVYHQYLKFADVLAQMSAWVMDLPINSSSSRAKINASTKTCLENILLSPILTILNCKIVLTAEPMKYDADQNRF